MLTFNLAGGALPWVAWHQGDLYVAVMIPQTGPLTVYRVLSTGGLAAVLVDTQATTNGYPRLQSDGATLWAAYRVDVPSERARLAWTTTGQTWGSRDLLATGGNNPVALSLSDVAQMEVTDDGRYFEALRQPLTGGTWAELGPCPGTGIAYLTDNSFVSIDANRQSVPGMLNPVRCAGLTVGEVDATGPRCVLDDGRGGILWAGDGEWINPACAVNPSDGRFAVCAWGKTSARVSVLTAAEIAALPRDATTPPAPVPIPVPVPVPPMPTPTPTPNHFAIIQRVFEDGNFDLSNHEDAGYFTRAAIRELRKTDARWHELKKRPGQNQFDGTAVDAGLYLLDTGLSQSIDFVSGSAAPGAHIHWDDTDNEHTRRYTAADAQVPAAVPASTKRRPAIRRDWRGVTAFDLGVRLEAGNGGWIDFMNEADLNVARTVVASVYRTPRTLADGRWQTRLALAALRANGRQAEVVIICDSRDYKMTRDDIRNHVDACIPILVEYADAVAGVELWNEPKHGVQVAAAIDPVFNRELDEMIPEQFPVSWGAPHGGDTSLVLAGGSYLTWHADRSKTPEENGPIMGAARRATGLDVSDDEGIGIAEGAIPGKRTNDPDYGRRQAVAARQYGIVAVTLHLDAGLDADASKLGPVQRETTRRFVGERKTPGPTPPTPGPVPPIPPMPPVPPPQPPWPPDDLLDAPLTPAYPVGYRLWIGRLREIEAAARQWYREAHGWPPADSDIAHGLWRALNEGDRWQTLRRAFQETWPK